jgi:hypothetical protein
MKKQLVISLLVLTCTVAVSSIAAAESFFSPGAPQFSSQLVSGKTMVSSGYPNGSMTFNSNGSLTCTNYPAFVSCKRWQVQQDGTLQREFTDSHTGKTVEVVAIWKLLSKSGNTLQVQQTSNNSEGATAVTVTIQ